MKDAAQGRKTGKGFSSTSRQRKAAPVDPEEAAKGKLDIVEVSEEARGRYSHICRVSGTGFGDEAKKG